MREWLIHLRKLKGLTQQQVASKCFIERSYYSQIERGTRNPSINVAKNIASTLGFNPLKFFNSEFDFAAEEKRTSSINNTFPSDIISYFNSNEHAHMIYLYNNIQNYYINFLTYLLAVIQKNRHCIIVENEEDYCNINRELEKIYSTTEIKKYLHHFKKGVRCKKNLEEIVSCVKELQSQYKYKESIYIWLHNEKICQYDIIGKLEKSDIELDKILFVQTYKASLVSAEEHIKLMKKYPLLMTDGEIVNSPFFISKKSLVLPSFYIQEDL
ncbi:helix-turn-helix protein [Natranaerovirga pectinivora]|uniref:Helix-turn-helix protein n=1 Tax=Natranaerovirga pectinivora TaxID=682400 RepID=A0A4R3MKL0_9FIRM|nr:helix-turn-helix transcriptional regulator [Natranaerovirga pectinivora]TCT14919.1 helix-turn-helix protein [Natranaerovirga pectinivora]